MFCDIFGRTYLINQNDSPFLEVQIQILSKYFYLNILNICKAKYGTKNIDLTNIFCPLWTLIFPSS